MISRFTAVTVAVCLTGLTACTTPGAANDALSLKLANTALAGGAPQLALQVSNALLAHDPHNVDALIRQGDAYYALGEPNKAADSYDEALKFHPRSVNALLGLGRVALASDLAQAGRDFDRVLALAPGNAVALTDRGIVYDLAGNHGLAQADYREAIARQTDATATQVDLGLSLAMSGQAGEAITILQPIAASADATPRERQDLAVALVLDGQPDKATHILEADMSPEDAHTAVQAYQDLAAPRQADGTR